MKNLPHKVFMNCANTWKAKGYSKCLPVDFTELRDTCGECITFTFNEPAGENDPEYVLDDKCKFVPGDWGWERLQEENEKWHNFTAFKGDYYNNGIFFLRVWGFGAGCEILEDDSLGLDDGVESRIYIGKITPTLYRLIAEANGIPIPENKQ